MAPVATEGQASLLVSLSARQRSATATGSQSWAVAVRRWQARSPVEAELPLRLHTLATHGASRDARSHCRSARVLCYTTPTVRSSPKQFPHYSSGGYARCPPPQRTKDAARGPLSQFRAEELVRAAARRGSARQARTGAGGTLLCRAPTRAALHAGEESGVRQRARVGVASELASGSSTGGSAARGESRR